MIGIGAVLSSEQPAIDDDLQLHLKWPAVAQSARLQSLNQPLIEIPISIRAIVVLRSQYASNQADGEMRWVPLVHRFLKSRSRMKEIVAVIAMMLSVSGG